MKPTLWTKNYCLLIAATVLGSIGGIAANFALSFLVFDETGSTLASALILAIGVVPNFIIPMVAAPWLDRLPRKPFLVAGDAVNGLIFLGLGLYIKYFEFSYAGYLAFSLALSAVGAFDSLVFQSIYPALIEPGFEQKGYSVASMLYPVMHVIMMPAAAILLEKIGVAAILISQGILAMLASAVESRIKVVEENRMEGEDFSLTLWWNDIKEAAAYLKKEKGLRSIYNYMAVTMGMASGYSPLLVAFFCVTAGFTTAMYALFSVAEFIGRTLGGLFHYNVKIPVKKRFPFAFLVYTVYESMDICLLWLPYPVMLVNRGLCGFLGINSASLREASVQQYIPDSMRARMNAWQEMLTQAAAAVLTLFVGFLGDIMDYRLCLSVCGAISLSVCFATIWKNRAGVRVIYETQTEEVPEEESGEE